MICDILNFRQPIRRRLTCLTVSILRDNLPSGSASESYALVDFKARISCSIHLFRKVRLGVFIPPHLPQRTNPDRLQVFNKGPG